MLLEASRQSVVQRKFAVKAISPPHSGGRDLWDESEHARAAMALRLLCGARVYCGGLHRPVGQLQAVWSVLSRRVRLVCHKAHHPFRHGDAVVVMLPKATLRGVDLSTEVLLANIQQGAE